MTFLAGWAQINAGSNIEYIANNDSHPEHNSIRFFAILVKSDVAKLSTENEVHIEYRLEEEAQCHLCKALY